jgi:aryl-phospho-beta-D-glucosidase BglC (GH1 family)
MDVLVAAAASRGLLILLDLHHLTAASGITELWYNEDINEATYIQAWEAIVLR